MKSKIKNHVILLIISFSLVGQSFADSSKSDSAAPNGKECPEGEVPGVNPESVKKVVKETHDVGSCVTTDDELDPIEFCRCFLDQGKDAISEIPEMERYIGERLTEKLALEPESKEQFKKEFGDLPSVDPEEVNNNAKPTEIDRGNIRQYLKCFAARKAGFLDETKDEPEKEYSENDPGQVPDPVFDDTEEQSDLGSKNLANAAELSDENPTFRRCK